MIRYLIVLCIRMYRLCLSPMLAPACRYHPSCSEFAIEALRVHGLYGGGARAVKRLFRCHPFGGWGYDPVD